jgi:hypothetical protein
MLVLPINFPLKNLSGLSPEILPNAMKVVQSWPARSWFNLLDRRSNGQGDDTSSLRLNDRDRKARARHKRHLRCRTHNWVIMRSRERATPQRRRSTSSRIEEATQRLVFKIPSTELGFVLPRTGLIPSIFAYFGETPDLFSRAYLINP